MGVNPKIFKAYDIRGVYPGEINEKAVQLIGRAFAFWISRKTKKPPKIVLSRDVRLSSPSLGKAALRGLIESGASVVDCGITTAPMHYFIINQEKADGGLMITASHNPKEYNGIKLSRKEAVPLSEATGLLEIRDLICPVGSDLSDSFGVAGGLNRAGFGRKEKIAKKNYLKKYVDFLSKFAAPETKNLKIAVDNGSGMAGLVLPRLFKKLKIKCGGLYLKPDGRFPYHEANPMKEETLAALKELMKKGKYDLGLAFDGDGDRVAFLDEKGEVLFASFVLALAAREFLKKNKGAAVVYDFRSSRIVPEIIKESGGRAVSVRVGHSFIKAKIREEKAVFGGELSGHYFFRDFFYCDSALMMAVKILNILARSGKKISELVSPFKKYWHSGEINFRLAGEEEKRKKLEAISEKYEKGKKDWSDGLLFEFPDFWFSVRPSNTEPVLRFVLEAKSRELMEEKTEEISNILRR